MKAQQSDHTEREGVLLTGLGFARAGFAFREQHELDYGIDAIAELTEAEQATGRLIALQIKSGASYNREVTDDSIVFRFDDRHYRYWIDHVLPVVACVADPTTDTVYWEAVTEATAISTGQDWKILVPRTQVIGPSSTALLSDLATPVVATTRYDVMEQDDISNGLTKRYRLRVVLNGEPSKAEVATIARQVTAEYAKRTYNRNDTAAQRWGDTQASVVVAFFYSSVGDLEGGNPVCTSQWASPELSDELRPAPLSGSAHLGDGFALEWSKHHQLLAELHVENRQTKGEYLVMVDALTTSMTAAWQSLDADLHRVENGEISEKDFIAGAQQEFAAIDQSNGRLLQSGMPPIGCNELDQKLNGVNGHLTNVVLFFTQQTFLSRDPSNRLWLARDALDGAAEDLTALARERQRVI